MDSLLLEKAETQQSLAQSRKELERTKQQAKVEIQQHVLFTLSQVCNISVYCKIYFCMFISIDPCIIILCRVI